MLRTAIEAEQRVANPIKLWDRVYEKIKPLKGPFTKMDISNIYSAARTMPGQFGDFVA